MDRDDMPGMPRREHSELRGSLERDLGRLQGLMDGAVEPLRAAFTRIGAAVESADMPAQVREGVRQEVRQILVSLQFHDIASQLIANLRNRAALLELAALAGAPGPAVPAMGGQEQSRLLDEASRLARRSPGEAGPAKGGDVELF